MTAIDIDGVAARFTLLTGLGDGAKQYRPLCEDATKEIERGERDGCGPESSGPLAAAAAALACYRYTLADECGGAGSFDAGDVKVAPEKKDAASARKLWREAFAAAAPYLTDASFLFRRTSP